MMAKKPTKAQIKKERSPEKRKKVLEKKGYPKGKLPPEKILHHPKPVSEGGKTTPSQTIVVSKEKHKKIHARRRKRGKA